MSIRDFVRNRSNWPAVGVAGTFLALAMFGGAMTVQALSSDAASTESPSGAVATADAPLDGSPSAVASPDPAPSAAPTAASSIFSSKTTFDIVFADGTRVSTTVEVAEPMHANDPNALGALRQENGGDGNALPACLDQPEPTRDAVIVGRMSFQNQTPGFQARDVAVRPDFPNAVGLVNNFAVYYNGKPECPNKEYQPVWGVNPAPFSDNWGPATFVILLSDYFSPEFPDGKPSTRNYVAADDLSLPTGFVMPKVQNPSRPLDKKGRVPLYDALPVE